MSCIFDYLDAVTICNFIDPILINGMASVVDNNARLCTVGNPAFQLVGIDV